MSVFSANDFDNHEAVLFVHDQATGLKAIIAVHDTTLGPALGGTRMWKYESEEAALADVLRLSRGMTYKSSLAGINLGGGKSVIIGDSRTDKTPALMEAFGRAIDQLGGRYIAAEDVGTDPTDLEHARRATRHIAGIAEGNAGDPSPATAFGVFQGLKAAVLFRLKKDSLAGMRVAVQGLGHVGFGLCKLLKDGGAKIIVADINEALVRKAVTELGATATHVDAIYDQEVEVFAPCALGAILNDNTIPRLKAHIVAGSANNQLAEPRHAEALMARGILYTPDYALNAGGIILVSHEGPSFDREKAMHHVGRIYDTCLDIFKRAEREERTTAEIADRIAFERLSKARKEKAALALAS